MNISAAILWKEWRETRIYLLIALGIFVLLPLIGGLEYLAQYGRHFHIEASMFVYPLGGVLAVFVAVGGTCRDLRPKLEDFWRSRPVSPVQWMLVKFGIGLAIVEVSCLLPLWIEYFTSADAGLRWQMPRLMLWFVFYWVMIYSVGFLCGVILRRTAHAAVLAFALLLLIYLLPTIFPPLSWLSIMRFSGPYMDMFQAAWAAPRMLAIAVPLLALSLVAARWQWHIEPGPKFMYGSISAVVLIFLLSAGYHLGTNLPVLQTVELPSGEKADGVNYYNGAVYFMTKSPSTKILGPRGWQVVEHWYFRGITLDADGMKLSTPTPYDPQHIFWPWSSIRWYWAGALNGNIAYFPEFAHFIDREPMDLITVSLGPYFQMQERIDSLRLPLRFSAQGHNPSPRPYVWKNHLYLIGHTLIMLDISNPRKPQLISSAPLGYPEPGDGQQTDFMPDTDTLVFDLPNVPGLPPAQRLDFAMGSRREEFDGAVLCRFYYGELQEFRLSQLTDAQATFKLVGTIRPGLIDYLFGYAQSYDVHLQNGLFYVSQGYNGNFNPRVSVYQTRGPGAPRMIAHFASPGSVMSAAPLPDGRTIIVGSKIWLVGPPPNHE